MKKLTTDKKQNTLANKLVGGSLVAGGIAAPTMAYSTYRNVAGGHANLKDIKAKYEALNKEIDDMVAGKSGGRATLTPDTDILNKIVEQGDLYASRVPHTINRRIFGVMVPATPNLVNETKVFGADAFKRSGVWDKIKMTAGMAAGAPGVGVDDNGLARAARVAHAHMAPFYGEGGKNPHTPIAREMLTGSPLVDAANDEKAAKAIERLRQMHAGSTLPIGVLEDIIGSSGMTVKQRYAPLNAWLDSVAKRTANKGATLDPQLAADEALAKKYKLMLGTRYFGKGVGSPNLRGVYGENLKVLGQVYKYMSPASKVALYASLIGGPALAYAGYNRFKDNTK